MTNTANYCIELEHYWIRILVEDERFFLICYKFRRKSHFLKRVNRMSSTWLENGKVWAKQASSQEHSRRQRFRKRSIQYSTLVCSPMWYNLLQRYGIGQKIPIGHSLLQGTCRVLKNDGQSHRTHSSRRPESGYAAVEWISCLPACKISERNKISVCLVARLRFHKSHYSTRAMHKLRHQRLRAADEKWKLLFLVAQKLCFDKFKYFFSIMGSFIFRTNAVMMMTK